MLALLRFVREAPVADAEQYRDWASQQIDTRTRDAMLREADRIDRGDAPRSSSVLINITIREGGTR